MRHTCATSNLNLGRAFSNLRVAAGRPGACYGSHGCLRATHTHTRTRDRLQVRGARAGSMLRQPWLPARHSRCC